MKSIIKDEVPSFWSKYCKNNAGIHYNQADLLITRELKLHMLKNQKNICAYCCAVVNESKSHNEHIKPKDLYPQLSMDYFNLIVSCTTQGEESTCGMHKKNNYDECLFVSPLSENCERHFRFERNGKIVGITEEGTYTIELLNLNAYRLVSARKTLIDEMNRSIVCGKEYIQQYYIDENDGRLPRFADMAEFFMKEGYYDPD